jgi:CheY-like chemotaxis protein
MPSAAKILVVDDSGTVRCVLDRMLTLAGYSVVLAGDGVTALEKARRTNPDLVILDIQMPLMDGYAVCQRMKAIGPPWDRTPIIFLTSVESNALDLLGHAMGDYVRKPVDPTRLLSSVERLLADHDRQEQLTAALKTRHEEGSHRRDLI